MSEEGRWHWTCSRCGEWFIMARWMLPWHAEAFPGHKVTEHYEPPLTEEQAAALNAMFTPVGTSGTVLTAEIPTSGER